MSTSRGSKTRPSLRHLNIFDVGLGQAAQPAGAGLQAPIVIVAESGLVHEIEHRLNVVLDPMQREFAVVSGEGGPRIIVPRLSYRAGIAVGLAVTRANDRDMRMSRREAVAGNLVEIRIGPFQIFVDRIGPPAVNDAQVVNEELYRKSCQPFEVLGGDHLSLVGETVIDAPRSRTRAPACHVPVVIA